MARNQRKLSRKQQEWRPGQRKKPASVLVMFGATTLLMEAFVVFFGGLAVFGLWGEGHPGRVPVLIGAAMLAVVFGLASGMVSKPWGPTLGWILQLVLLATGFVLPAMFIVGAIFVLCWWYSLRTGRRMDREKRQRYEAELEWDRQHGLS
ncbi:DUF4233 domain-containing protein [Kocuria sp. p3-SID1428]|uniref:DUF4233 domain-containing protein n=2 Tax=unclassified Kocuria TaxID=2649579 RepID=UPI0021A63E68|nr:DUF4233 domain-containing protein [Kocuria sp. p3-SID1428]MCT1603002.1 DUF4233 domain-containing protein [Kocuria sp. p3-SID1428]